APRTFTCATGDTCPATTNTTMATFDLTCGSGNPAGQQWFTANQMCNMLGYPSAVAAYGYWLRQCGGPGADCPVPWNGFTCQPWVDGTGTDCTDTILVYQQQRSGDGNTSFMPEEFAGWGYDCYTWNPGWTVRLQCVVPDTAAPSAPGLSAAASSPSSISTTW